MEVYQHRNGLTRTRQAMAQGQLRVGFLGGSITDGRSGHNWPHFVISELKRWYPDLHVIEENAAIGATGSDLGVFLAEPCIIDRGCQLVFVEYAVNDRGREPAQRRRSQEGLIRKLLADGTRDVVLVYTFAQPMYLDMAHGWRPETIRELEELAVHYGVSSVWVGAHAFEAVQNGRIRWEHWLPDGLHPGPAGSELYAEAVINFLRNEISGTTPRSALPRRSIRRPRPLDTTNWEYAAIAPLERVRTSGPWILRRWAGNPWLDQVWETSAIGARMTIDFEGRGICLGFDFGKASSEFRYQIDQSDWLTSKRDRPDWVPDQGWLYLSTLAEGLPDKTHRLTLEVVHGDMPECRGTNCRIGLVGVLP